MDICEFLSLDRIRLSLRQTGPQRWQCLCPAHADSATKSLCITSGDDGRILLKCQAGCETKAVCEALGITFKDLFPNNGDGLKRGKPRRKIVATYDYTDANGQLLYQTVRHEPKTFAQRRPDGKAGWIWNLNGVRRVPYRLLQLITAEPDAWVFVPEGEKDCDNLVGIGLVATCNPMGAGKWADEYNEHFRGRRVCVLPDNDRPGSDHAQDIVHALLPVATEVKVLLLPDLPPKGDVSDWIERHDPVELEALKAQLLVMAEQAAPAVLAEPAVEAVGQHGNQPWTGKGDFHLTDCGNAERFASQHSDAIRYCADLNTWLYYDGQRWNAQEGLDKARQLAVQTVRSILIEASRTDDGDRREKLATWALRSEASQRIAGMLTLAQSLPAIVCYSREFDKNPDLVTCVNGTINLLTGEIRPHSPHDKITRLDPVEYDSNATLPEWTQLLDTITGGQRSVKDFLQMAVGYSLTGNTSEEKLFFLHGDTLTGKSTLLEAVKAAFGEYAMTADFETFLKRSQTGGIRNDIAALAGARMVISIEVDEGKKLAEGLIKMLTGGDHVRARLLYKESFEFLPQFKLWLAANDAPDVKDTDSAIWRRIIRVPFEHKIDKPDPHFKALLRDPKVAGPAILAWAVRGCLMWRHMGLRIPDRLRAATEEYRESQNPLKDFFEDSCEFEKEAIIPVTALRAAYDQWAQQQGVRHTLGRQAFNERLRQCGCVSKTTKYRNAAGTEYEGKCWHGVTIKNSGFEKRGESAGADSRALFVDKV